MRKLLIIFTVSLAATLLCGAIITYPMWSGLLKSHETVAETSAQPEEPDGTDAVKAEEPAVKPVVEAIPTPTPEPFEEYDITLMAVGDDLLHLGLVNSGKQPDGTLNYDFLYEDIAPYLDKSDISIINQETIMAGNQLGFSGFPYFNSPVEVADAIEKAGFNVVLQSTNHTIDQGLDGLLNVCKVWDEHPNVLMVGIHEDTADARDIPIMEIKDKKFAILNYTYGPNLGAVPSDIIGHMNILCKIKEGSNYNELDLTTLDPAVIEDIEKAETMADIVIVCPHWGTEYATEPSSYQIKWAKQMTEAGADVIIGAHPHVPEPVEWISAPNGNRCLCYYSLGNYVSTGQEGKSMLEGMAWVVFHVTEDGVAVDENRTGVLPLVMQYLSGPLRFEGVYALDDYTDELASKHGIRSWGGVNLTVEKLRTWSSEIFGEWTLSKEYVLED
ncbi:MAG: CapA family protein [Lachnospiraceae bacterium]|nr:CapA family protein [Lachnospiraceae bacterium]